MLLNSENYQLHVLIVDADRACLAIIDNVLRNYGCTVMRCEQAPEALSILETGMNRFDLVIIDLQMPDMDVLDFITHSTSLNVRVIVTSSNHNEDVWNNARWRGASVLIGKPIQVEHIKEAWTYVSEAQQYRNNKNKRLTEGGGVYSEEEYSNPHYEKKWLVIGVSDATTTTNDNDLLGFDNDDSRSKEGEGNKCLMNKRKACNPPQNNNHESTTNNVGDANGQVIDPNQGMSSDIIKAPAKKKQRVIWTSELHEKFVAAVNKFGTSKAVPKKILEFMSIPGLTRENVASHLQKYRQYHKKLEESLQQRSDGNPMKLVSSKEQKCSKRISQTKVRNAIVTNASFSQPQCQTAQLPIKIETNTMQDMITRDITIQEGKKEMQMPYREVVNEENMVNHNNYLPSYLYNSPIYSSFHLLNSPGPYWGSVGFPYDENNVNSEVVPMNTVAQHYGYGQIAYDENSVHIEPEFSSMTSFTQPYGNGDIMSHDESSVHDNELNYASMMPNAQPYAYRDVISHDENSVHFEPSLTPPFAQPSHDEYSVHNESEIASVNAMQPCGYGDTSSYDFGYIDPLDHIPTVYGEPFDQNNEHVIAHLQQQDFGPNVRL